MLENINEDIENDAWLAVSVDKLLLEISLFFDRRDAFAAYLRERGLE